MRFAATCIVALMPLSHVAAAGLSAHEVEAVNHLKVKCGNDCGEANILKTHSDIASRAGDRLTLKVANGVKTYVNNNGTEPDGKDVHIVTLVRYIPETDGFILDRSGYEWGSSEYVDRKTGHTIDLVSSELIFSADGKHMLNYQGQTYGYDDLGIDVYNYDRSKGFRKIPSTCLDSVKDRLIPHELWSNKPTFDFAAATEFPEMNVAWESNDSLIATVTREKTREKMPNETIHCRIQ